MSDLVNLTVLQANLEKPETTSLATESDCNKLKIPLVRVMALSSLGKARLKEKATGDALRLFGQAIAEADKIKEDQDRLQAKLMLVQLFMDVNSSSGFERAAEAFKAINHFSDFNMNRSYFAVKVTVCGMMSEEPVIPPAQSSLVSTVAKMCRLNCEETFQVSGLLEKKELRLWATFVAVQTGLRESSKEARQ
jgi:purine nucleoside permease